MLHFETSVMNMSRCGLLWNRKAHFCQLFAIMFRIIKPTTSSDYFCSDRSRYTLV